MCACLLVQDTSKVQADLCGLPKESKASDVYIYTITVFAIAGLFVTLRIIGKIATKRIAMDDWIMIAAFAILVAPVACVLKSRSSALPSKASTNTPPQWLESDLASTFGTFRMDNYYKTFAFVSLQHSMVSNGVLTSC